jgi:hypothetical protein
VADAAAGGLESERYDKGMLDALMGFKDFLRSEQSKVILNESGKRQLFAIDSASLQIMEKVRTSFPDPKLVLVAGECDMIEKSTRKFKMILSDGHVVMGKAAPDRIGLHELKNLFGSKVTVRGTMHYMANGKPRLLDAEMIRPFETGDTLFEQLSASQDLKNEVRRVRDREHDHDLVSQIWGKWPGDESIEELLELAREKG